MLHNARRSPILFNDRPHGMWLLLQRVIESNGGYQWSETFELDTVRVPCQTSQRNIHITCRKITQNQRTATRANITAYYNKTPPRPPLASKDSLCHTPPVPCYYTHHIGIPCNLVRSVEPPKRGESGLRIISKCGNPFRIFILFKIWRFRRT